jgi:hypothetical protein
MTEKSEEQQQIQKEEAEVSSGGKRKSLSVPSEGYVCKLCGVPGHWMEQCSLPQPKKKRKNKRNKNKDTDGSTHEYRPGVDPSPKDIEKAKKMQQIKPPMCDCGIPSRVKKVKRSKVTANSRANGSYFFFCAKKKEDATKCNFAQPVEETQKTKKEKVQSNFFAKKRKGL